MAKKKRENFKIKKIVSLLAIILLAISLIKDPPSKDEYLVKRVVDGDTIIVEKPGQKEERLRMIGIDTPESVHPDKSKNTPEGKVASDYTKRSLEGKRVKLEFDVSERDRYGRLLAYVYLDGNMYNKELLEQGLARVATYPPNVRYEDDFLRAERKAREEGKGFWKDYYIEDQLGSSKNGDNKRAEEKSGKEEPGSYQVIGNKNSKIYHDPDSPSVKNMKEENKVYFKSEDEALEAGYRKAKN